MELSSDLVKSLGARCGGARLFGGCAFAKRIDYPSLFGKDRSVKDIDLVIFRNGRRAVLEYLRLNGWLIDRRSVLFGDARRITLLEPKACIRLDLYSDPLHFNHRILLGNRLTIDSECLAPADLLVTKLQIVHATVQDDDDVIGLIASTPLNSREPDAISVSRLASMCAASWGLYVTMLANLRRLTAERGLRTLRSTHLAKQFGEKTEEILLAVKDYPKSLSWKGRALLGSRLPWYDEVEE